MRAFVLCSVLVLMGRLPAAAAEGVDWTKHPVNVWVKQTSREGAAVPRLTYEGSGALDPVRRLWIHFGGHDGIPQGFYLFTYDFGSGEWQQRFPNTSPPGVCCVDGSNTFDVARRRFVAFVGASLGHGSQWSRGVKLKQSHVWLYHAGENSWTNMRPQPYKQPEKYSREVIGGLNSGATYDANHEITITFGGQGAGGPTNALFVYDGYTNRLEQLHPPESPSRRDGMGICYDTDHDCLVMYGGQYSSDEQTWLYRFSTNRWEPHDLDPRPPGKKEGTYSTNPKMAFDSNAGVCLCVVRRGEKSGFPTGTLETWVLDVGKMKWTRMDPAVSPDPGASRARNLSYWPERNVFVLESVAAQKHEPQIWTYRYRKAGRPDRPEPPGDLRVVAGRGKATVSWTPSESAGVSSYNVYRAPAARPWKAEFSRIASVRAGEFVDADLAEGTVSIYRVTAVDTAGNESRPSQMARTQPRVAVRPVVSVLAADRVEVHWNRHPAPDVVGYNVYRGVVAVDTVRRGTPGAWKDNDPEYSEPVVVAVKDISSIRKLNETPVAEMGFTDTGIDLTEKGKPSGDYKYAVYAYIVRAVNRLGSESGPSPYALTIPSEPQHVMLRERDAVAELRWEPNAEKGVTGYRIYKLGKSHWDIVRVTQQPIAGATFRHRAGSGQTRYWVVAVDRLGQEGQPSSPVWHNHSYQGFYQGEWHQ